MEADTLNSAEGLAHVREEIAAACAEAKRDPASVTLIAVSKTFAADAIEPVIAAGQRVFGENRVQEAKAKWPVLREAHPGLALHLIGPLAVQQGQGGGRAVRRDPFGRPGEHRGGAGEGDHQAGQAAAAVRRDQHRRRGSEGGRVAGERRRLHQDVPRDAGFRDRRLDVHPAIRGSSGATLCAHRQDRGAQWAEAAVHGHERGLRDRDRFRGDPRAGRHGDLRRPAQVMPPKRKAPTRGWGAECVGALYVRWPPQPPHRRT